MAETLGVTFSADYSPILTKKPLLTKKKSLEQSAMSSEDRVKPKLSDEALKAQCVPAAIKLKKVPLVRQDSDTTVYLSSDDENAAKLRSVSIDSPAKRSRSTGGSQSSASTTSKPSKVREASEKSSPTVKSVQKKITDYKMAASPKVPSSMEVITIEDACEHEKSSSSSSSSSSSQSEKPATKRSKEYVFVSFNGDFEDQIKKCSNLKQLTEDHIYYLVLRDVNRLIDIFSGCLKSWRHDEFNKKRGNHVLYENSALSNFTQVQFTSAFRGLETIFCKKSHKYDDYLLNVLLPEVLIAICARVYECSPENAEEFLRVTHSKSELETNFPKGSLKAAKLASAQARVKIKPSAVV